MARGGRGWWLMTGNSQRSHCTLVLALPHSLLAYTPTVMLTHWARSLHSHTQCLISHGQTHWTDSHALSNTRTHSPTEYTYTYSTSNPGIENTLSNITWRSTISMVTWATHLLFVSVPPEEGFARLARDDVEVVRHGLVTTHATDSLPLQAMLLADEPRTVRRGRSWPSWLLQIHRLHCESKNARPTALCWLTDAALKQHTFKEADKGTLSLAARHFVCWRHRGNLRKQWEPEVCCMCLLSPWHKLPLSQQKATTHIAYSRQAQTGYLPHFTLE